jgi:hypothetical protein
MTVQTPSTRRDPRFALPEGAGSVEFQVDGHSDVHYRAGLKDVSVAGLTFEMDVGPAIARGDLLRGAIVRIGECEVEGELAVRYIQVPREARIDVGCLFYPASQIGEEKWSSVVSGVRAAKGA